MRTYLVSSQTLGRYLKYHRIATLFQALFSLFAGITFATVMMWARSRPPYPVGYVWCSLISTWFSVIFFIWWRHVRSKQEQVFLEMKRHPSDDEGIGLDHEKSTVSG